MKYGIPEKLMSEVLSILQKHSEIDTAILYGSRAKGTFRNGSDIDITLTGQNITLSIVNKISNELDDLPTPYTFDISSFKQIQNPDLIERIKRVGKVIYQK